MNIDVTVFGCHFNVEYEYSNGMIELGKVVPENHAGPSWFDLLTDNTQTEIVYQVKKAVNEMNYRRVV